MPTDYVKSWFARGDDDLALVKLILEKGTGSSNLACFHAQQAVEKYLKGFLAHHDLHVRKVHDLEVLLEDCETVDSSFAPLRDSARFLSQFYVESRYPDDYVEFSYGDAKGAYEAALRIKEFVLSKLKSGGSRGGFGAIGIIAVVAVLGILIGGGYFAYQRFAKVPEPSASQATPPSSNGEIDASNWKTYRSEKYGFEVRYPPDWELVDETPQNSRIVKAELKIRHPSGQQAFINLSKVSFEEVLKQFYVLVKRNDPSLLTKLDFFEKEIIGSNISGKEVRVVYKSDGKESPHTDYNFFLDFQGETLWVQFQSVSGGFATTLQLEDLNTIEHFIKTFSKLF